MSKIKGVKNEFEELWDHEHPSGVHPEGCLCQACEWENEEKPEAKRWYLQGRQRGQEKMEKLKKELKELRELKQALEHYGELKYVGGKLK
jgi:hypothetical protein